MYICNLCNYKTNKKFNYDKHLKCKKHINNKEESQIFFCEYCNKSYKYHKSYLNHSCINDDNQLKKMLKKVMKENKEIKKNINNIATVNNYHLNINIFLQQECNNAINWFDFIKSLNIGESEINDAINTNLTSSMTNVLLKGINDLGKTKRPIHCLDVKRKKLCIKDNNIWIKDQYETSKKINKGEEILQNKYIKAVNLLDDDNLDNKYIDICKKISDDINYCKINRKISNETII